MRDENDGWGRLNVFRGGEVHVKREMCGTCIFRPGNLMQLKPGRVKDMVQEALAEDTAIVCHDTLQTNANGVCRGFWDRHRCDSWRLRFAQMLGIVAED